MVDNHIRIAFVAGCEHNNFKMFTELLQAFSGIGPDVDACFYGGIVGKCDGKGDIIGDIYGLITVN